ncbi:MAG: hypothetical protein AAF355_09695 [Myxococcota bacterium]
MREAGRAWATDVRTQLHAEERRACGGWPGTLSEAEARAAREFRRSSIALEAADRHGLVKILYAAAKDHWHDQREPAERDE